LECHMSFNGCSMHCAVCARDRKKEAKCRSEPLATVGVLLLFHALGLSVALVVAVRAVGPRGALVILGATSKTGPGRSFAFGKRRRRMHVGQGWRGMRNRNERSVLSVNKFCIIVRKRRRTTVKSLLGVFEMDLALGPMFSSVCPFRKRFDVVHSTKDLVKLGQKGMTGRIIRQSVTKTGINAV
jgi:hypothetical protein